MLKTRRIRIDYVDHSHLGRAKIETITFEIPCQSAAFGVARIPIPIAKELQGKRQSFEVGASVDYPEGRGRRVRYFDGIFLRTNAKFGNSFGTALVVAGALTGSIVMTRPAKTTVLFPAGVAEEYSRDPSGNVYELEAWRPAPAIQCRVTGIPSP